MSIDEVVSKAAKRARTPKRAPAPNARAAAHQRAVAEANTRIERKDWRDVDGNTVVGLYSVLHSKVYGVPPIELDGIAFAGAVSSATRIVRELGSEGAIDLLRWTWKREEQRERRRRENGEDGGRIGWRIQFSASLLTDYRVHQARRGR